MLGGWGEAGAVGRLLDSSTLHDSTARVKSLCAAAAKYARDEPNEQTEDDE